MQISHEQSLNIFNLFYFPLKESYLENLQNPLFFDNNANISINIFICYIIGRYLLATYCMQSAMLSKIYNLSLLNLITAA